MQIHEITESKQLEEALGGLGSFMSGLTGGLSDRFMDKTPGGVKQGPTGFRANPNDYSANASTPSTKWQDKYKSIQADPAVTSYVNNIAASWAKNPMATAAPATQGLATGATLQKTVPSLVTAAKKTNNKLTSAQIGQILSQSAPTIWNNTQDKSSAIKLLAAELRKQGVTVDDKAMPGPAAVVKPSQVATTPQGTTYDPAKAAADKLAKGQADQSATVAALKARQLGQYAPAPAPKTTTTANTVQPTQPATTTTATPAKVRPKYPKARASGAVAEPPVFLGGKKLDPKKPGDAKTLAAIKAQGKLHEAVATGPAADQYRAAFTKWTDSQFASRVKETGTTVTMDAVRKAFPDLAAELATAVNKVVASRGTPQQTQAVKEYSQLAVAGVQALAQVQKNKLSAIDQEQNKQISNTSGSVKQSLAQAGVNPGRLSQIGGNQSVRRTGNPTADSLLKLSGFKI